MTLGHHQLAAKKRLNKLISDLGVPYVVLMHQKSTILAAKVPALSPHMSSLLDTWPLTVEFAAHKINGHHLISATLNFLV